MTTDEITDRIEAYRCLLNANADREELLNARDALGAMYVALLDGDSEVPEVDREPLQRQIDRLIRAIDDHIGSLSHGRVAH